MKITIAITMCTFSCCAQTYVTNYVKADPAFRRVEGKLYNTQKSVLWEYFKGECINVLTNGVVLQKFEVKKIYKTEKSDLSEIQRTGGMYVSPNGGPRRKLISETKTLGQKFIVRNYPPETAAAGQLLEGKAFRVGSVNYEGTVLELWDFGTPNVVPVVSIKR